MMKHLLPPLIWVVGAIFLVVMAFLSKRNKPGEQTNMSSDGCEDEVERTKALQELITATVAALGEEKAKPFELDAFFECVEMGYSDDQVCPRVRLVKR